MLFPKAKGNEKIPVVAGLQKTVAWILPVLTAASVGRTLTLKVTVPQGGTVSWDCRGS